MRAYVYAKYLAIWSLDALNKANESVPKSMEMFNHDTQATHPILDFSSKIKEVSARD